MEILFDIFSLSFMQRALVGGFFLSALLAFLGVFVVMRKMSFFAEGVAHASLIGMAIAVLVGQMALPYALVSGVIIALLIYFFEKRSSISRDALIGVLFTVSMALGVIIISFQQGYQPDLISFLFGNVLSISSTDMYIILPIASTLLLLLFFFYKRFAVITLDPDGSSISGISVTFYEVAFYISLAVATVLGVKLLGVVLVSALIVLPASISKLITKKFTSFVLASVFVSELFVFLGLLLSYYFDTPSGATIVVLGFIFFVCAFIYNRLFKK